MFSNIFISLCLSKLQLTAVRTIPWAKANLNYTAQALIISGGKNDLYNIIFFFQLWKCLFLFITIIFRLFYSLNEG